MLFQRLYNWIKYKTLPPSFLFKNRLFIERDSKHRRVFTNFGLSFRNSKWSNYETYNIKLQFKKNYYRFIFWILVFIFFFIFIIYFNKYYILFYFFNNISFIFWISVDTFDYYLSFFIWIFTAGISVFFNTLYSYFFFNNFSSNNSNKIIFSNNSFNKLNLNTFLKKNDLYVSKGDLNWLLYSWLSNPSSKNNNVVLEKLFDTNVNKIWWNRYYDFFIKLYKLSFLINLSSENKNKYNLLGYLNTIANNSFLGNYNNFLNFFNNSSLSSQYNSIMFFFIIKNHQNYFDIKNNENFSLNFLNTNNHWNLYNFSNELENYSYLLKHKTGMFYLNDFNYKNFSYLFFNYPELWSLNISLKTQLNASKWNRWLYRYSILHRKILKNSHKITLAKRLVNSGFYDSKIFNKNIWSTEHLVKMNNSTEFNSLFSNLYSYLFKKNSLETNSFFTLVSNNGNQKNTLSLLNFYEESYFWFLKRFYLFNNLSTNYIKSNVSFNNSNRDFFILNNNLKNSNSLHYSLLLSYLLKSSYINLNNYSHFYNNIENFNEFYLNFNNNNIENLKDFFLLNNANELFIKDNLNIFYWITSTQSKNNNLAFFDYLNINDFNTYKVYSNFYTNNPTSLNLDFWLAYSLINFDKYLINDISYLTLFI